LNEPVEELNRAVEEAGQGREDVRLLMTHPGVGRIVALTFALTIGPAERFPSSKQLVSYGGLHPSEHSSGGGQKLGSISKQGHRLLRALLVEAAQTAARVEPNLRRPVIDGWPLAINNPGAGSINGFAVALELFADLEQHIDLLLR
jgi:transposase